MIRVSLNAYFTQVDKRAKVMERVVVLSVGPSGYLQLAASHDSPDVRAIAELLTDSRTREHIRETIYRSTKRMSVEDLKIAVARAVGESTVHLPLKPPHYHPLPLVLLF